MSKCFCTPYYLCRSCRDGIDAAESEPIFDPRLADDEAERVCGGPYR